MNEEGIYEDNEILSYQYHCMICNVDNDGCEDGSEDLTIDTDGDGVEDGTDNCKYISNGPLGGPDNQADYDGDGQGDAC